jgi:hypothetical protein
MGAHMKLKLFTVAALPWLMAGGAVAGDWKSEHPYDPNVQDLTERAESVTRPHYTRAEHGARQARTGGGTTSPNMTNHGGSTMSTLATKAIFWGPSWTPTDPKVGGMDLFFAGWNGSNAAKMNSEYRGATSTLPYNGHLIDNAAVTAGAGDGGNGAAIVAEICKLTSNRPDSYTHYAVLSETKRGVNQFCAFHGASSCPGTGVAFTYSFYFNLDGDPGCDPQDPGTVTLHSQGLAALGNVVSHELSETVTDPGVLILGGSWLMGVGAWFDSNGYENGDKCAWTFGAPYVTFSNGTKWKIQGEWSNKAYTAGTGYPNSAGQRGCLAGGP